MAQEPRRRVREGRGKGESTNAALRGSQEVAAPRPFHPPNAMRYGFQADFDPSAYNRYYLMAGWDEARVQKMVVERLRALRYIVEEVDAGLRKVRAVLMQRGSGRLPAAGRRGLSDLVGCSPEGRGLFIEVKRPAHMAPDGRVLAPAGKPTPEQLTFLDRVHRAGAIAGVSWGPCDLDGILRPWPLNGV